MISYYFNPPTPCGVGPDSPRRATMAENFNPPTPCGVGPLLSRAPSADLGISIHPPLAGWDVVMEAVQPPKAISIHPPLAGWDSVFVMPLPLTPDFNPPTPCGVGPSYHRPTTGTTGFQSTHPLRGGTGSIQLVGGFLSISIHPPLAGWDDVAEPTIQPGEYFNPPTPCGVGRSIVVNLYNHGNFNPPTPCGVGREEAGPRK